LARADSVELQVQAYLLGDSLDGEVPVKKVGAPVGPYRSGGKRGNWILLHVEEVPGLDVTVALLVARVQ
jgi:hypothetical protein